VFSRADGVAQVLERLPSKGEAQSSNPTIGKKKKKNILERGLGMEHNYLILVPWEAEIGRL
jgi:hypothetical protein